MARFSNIKEFTKYLNQLGYKDLKEKGSNGVMVLTNASRSAVFATLLQQLGGRKNSSTAWGGSMGHIDVDGYRVGVKPLSRQGAQSAGVDNEKNLEQGINFVIQEYGPCDVVFTDGTISFTALEVKKAKMVGADTAGRKKADLMLEGKNNYPISLKKDNAEYWESADSFWRENAQKYLTEAVRDKKVVVSQVNSTVIKITPNIGVEATDKEAVDVIFGSDILGKGCVITRTFEGNDFKYDGRLNRLTINVSSVITKLSEVPATKKVWFLIRNDSTRKSIPNYPGTRALAAYKSRITGSVIQITKSNRTD